MNKKFTAGLLLGAGSAYLGWRSLTPEQRQHLARKFQRGWYEAVDTATDFALESFDLASVALDKYRMASGGKWQSVADAVKDRADQVADHFTNADFDEETAAIRDELQRAKRADDSSDDDIVINLDDQKN
ncbi:hypothetical protein [Limosilactobacillus sp.]|uniref:hypothetical protein n=1 Tax=Limosilactobacillus sp. TaxID=2773925 RepID=UPI00345E83BD